jgi:hypothetical protein
VKHRLSTSTTLGSPPDEVWRHLTDLPSYASWNPFITSASGTVAVGQRLDLRMEPPGGRAMTFRPTVTEVVPGRVFEWLGHLGVPGVFDGRHRFELHPEGDSTRLVHSEAFRGLLVPLLRRSLDGPTLAGFRAMNEALVRRVCDPQPV